MKILVYSELKDSSIATFLQAKRYQVDIVSSLNSARLKITDFDYEACVLEYSTLEKHRPEDIVPLREFNKAIPLVILCNAGTDYDFAVKSINLGADNFYYYPYNLRFVIAQLESLMCRTRQYTTVDAGKKEFNLGTAVFIPDQRSVIHPGKPDLKLTYKETAVLTLLCQAGGNYISRSSILKMVWYADTFYNGRNFDVLLCKLRRKLKNMDDTITIVNDCSNYRLIFVKDGSQED